MSLVSSTLTKKTNLLFLIFFNKCLINKIFNSLIFFVTICCFPFSKFGHVHVLAKEEVYFGMPLLKYFPVTMVTH